MVRPLPRESAAATELLTEASAVAERAETDRTDYEVVFGLSNVVMQSTDVAVVTEDYSGATSVAKRMPRGSALPLLEAQTEVGADGRAVDDRRARLRPAGATLAGRHVPRTGGSWRGPGGDRLTSSALLWVPGDRDCYGSSGAGRVMAAASKSRRCTIRAMT